MKSVSNSSHCVKMTSLAAVSLAALVAASSSALAGGFGIREQSAQAQGLSFAGAASGSGGLSSMFWNPATITMKPGWNMENSFSLIIPNAKFTAGAGTSPALLPLGANSGNIGIDAFVTAGYGNYQINDWIWLGYTLNAPFGLATKPNNTWAGQAYGRSSRVFSTAFSPIIGLKLNDWLSVGFGPTLEFLKVELKQATGIAPTSPSGFLKGDNYGIGFTGGLTLTPVAGTVIGLGYRSSIHHQLEGIAFGPGPIRANLNTPEKVSVGLTQTITSNLRVNLGFEWDNWSRVGLPPITSAITGAPLTALPLKYRDGYFYSFGAEYDINKSLTVRAGVGYEVSPITDSTRSVRLPDKDRIWLSLGASYNWNEKLSIDLAYSHLFVNKANLNLVPGNVAYIAPLPLIGKASSSVDIVSLGIKYRWDDPKVAIPARPVVRKY